MITCFGYEWDYIGEHLDIPKLNQITKYQRRIPPLHQLVAGYLGVNTDDLTSENNLNSFISDMKKNGYSETKKINRIKIQNGNE